MKKLIFTIISLLVIITVFCSFKETDDFFRYEETADGNIRIISYVGEKFSTTANIPSYIENKKVVEICESAFYNNQYLKSVTIPSTIEIIGAYAFAYCESLSSVTFESGQAPLTIPENCFEKCEKLKTVDFSDRISIIDEYAFADCISLQSVSFPSSITQIGYGAFFGCEQLIMKVDNCAAAYEYAKSNGIPTNFYQTDNFTTILIASLSAAILIIIFVIYKIFKYRKAHMKGNRSNETS